MAGAQPLRFDMRRLGSTPCSAGQASIVKQQNCCRVQNCTNKATIRYHGHGHNLQKQHIHTRMPCSHAASYAPYESSGWSQNDQQSSSEQSSSASYGYSQFGYESEVQLTSSQGQHTNHTRRSWDGGNTNHRDNRGMHAHDESGTRSPPQHLSDYHTRYKRVFNSKQILINSEIMSSLKCREVRLKADPACGEAGGVVPYKQALQMARDAGVDLVLVNGDAQPPVCQVMEWSKYMFILKQGEKDRKAKTVALETKEVRLRPKTDDHDLKVKAKAAAVFLDKGHSVRVTMRFEGRELHRRDQGREALLRFVESLSPHTRQEDNRELTWRGNTFTLTIHPTDGARSQASAAATAAVNAMKATRAAAKGGQAAEPAAAEENQNPPAVDAMLLSAVAVSGGSGPAAGGTAGRQQVEPASAPAPVAASGRGAAEQAPRNSAKTASRASSASKQEPSPTLPPPPSLPPPLPPLPLKVLLPEQPKQQPKKQKKAAAASVPAVAAAPAAAGAADAVPSGAVSGGAAAAAAAAADAAPAGAAAPSKGKQSRGGRQAAAGAAQLAAISEQPVATVPALPLPPPAATAAVGSIAAGEGAVTAAAAPVPAGEAAASPPSGASGNQVLPLPPSQPVAGSQQPVRVVLPVVPIMGDATGPAAAAAAGVVPAARGRPPRVRHVQVDRSRVGRVPPASAQQAPLGAAGVAPEVPAAPSPAAAPAGASTPAAVAGAQTASSPAAAAGTQRESPAAAAAPAEAAAPLRDPAAASRAAPQATGVAAEGAAAATSGAAAAAEPAAQSAPSAVAATVQRSVRKNYWASLRADVASKARQNFGTFSAPLNQTVPAASRSNTALHDGPAPVDAAVAAAVAAATAALAAGGVSLASR